MLPLKTTPPGAVTVNDSKIMTAFTKYLGVDWSAVAITREEFLA